MSSIDKRIVEMVFNNQNFENGVKTTINSLKNLNDKLKMENGTKGLDNISKSASKVNFGSLSSSIDTIASRFTTLGVIGTTALMNITNSAVNAGKRIASALVVEPVTDGFREYETKMGSIQTILTNTAHQGTTLKDVTKTLDELNEYADKTIYNFAEMTKNIGTFTAAGVDLKTSTAAIKGIANLAAASGSTSAQASSAMYQLSQALAAGRVSLQDWNSVVNAGMGGKLFQDALIRTSEVMGTGADAAIKKYGSFRESLTKGEWLTSDVLTETLKQISGAYTEAELKAKGYSDAQAKAIVQLADNATKAATEVKTVTQLFDTMKESVGSGWAQSWEYIIGDKDQATKTLTAISDAFNNIIQPSTDARNNMLKFWNENGGRDAVIKGLTNMFTGLGKGLGAVKEAFTDIFPPMTGKRLVEISKGFKSLTEKFKMSDETAGKIKDTFKGVFSVLNLGKNAVVTLFKSFSPLTKVFGSFGKGLLTVTSSIGKFITGINEAANKSGIFDKISNGINKAFEGIGKVLDGATKAVSSFFKSLGSINAGNMFDFIGKAFSGLANGIAPIIQGIGDALSSIDFGTILSGLNVLIGGGLLKVIKSGFDSLKDSVGGVTSIFDSIKDIADSVSGILDSVRDSLVAYQNNLNAGTLLKLAGAIGILAAALVVISTIDPVKMDSALSGIAVLFMELIASMALLMKVLSADKMKGIFKVSSSMLAMASAVLVLSFAMKQLASLSWEEIAKGLLSIVGLMTTLIATSKLMDKNSKGMIKTATGLVIFSAAIMVLSKAVETLGGMDVEVLIKGLTSVGVLVSELALFMKATDLNKLGMSKATGILIFAGALNVLALAVKQFGNMDTNALIQGLSGTAAVLTELAIFTRVVGGAGGIIGTATGLTILAVAMNILSAAIKSMGSMPLETIGKGLLSMAGALTVIGVAVAFMPKTMIITALGITAMAGALLVLSTALKSLGGQSWEEIAKSLVSMAGALTILAIAMAAMSTGLAGAAAMLVMSAALAIFVPQLIALSQLSLAQIGTSLLALAGAFAVLGVAALVLTPVIPSLFALAGAVALLGVACIGIGAGLFALGSGLTMIAASGGAAGAVLVGIIKELIGLLPLIGTKIAEAFGSFAEAIATQVPKIANAAGQLISGLLTALRDNIPQIVTVGAELVVKFGEAVVKAVPKLMDIGMKFITSVATGITKNMGKIVALGTKIIVSFLNGISKNIGQVIQAGINLAVNFVNGVANGIRSNSGAMAGAISNLISAMIQAGLSLLGAAVSPFVSAGINLIKGLINGIKGMISAVGGAVRGVISAAKGAVSGAASALVGAGRSLITGFISGIRSAASQVASAARGVVEKAISAAKSALKINSPSKVFIKIGGSVTEGFALGLTRYAKDVVKPSEDLANKAIESAKKPLSALSRMLDMDVDSTPVITPVIDLSNAKKGVDTLNGLLSNKSMSIAGTSGMISGTIGRVQNGTDNSDIISALKDLKNEMTNTNNVTYQVNGITYDDGSNITNAVETLVRAAKIERRI